VQFIYAACVYSKEFQPVNSQEGTADKSTRTLFGSVIRDIYQDDEQAEILQLAGRSSCELEFDKVRLSRLWTVCHL